jgi:hypothetical protein
MSEELGSATHEGLAVRAVADVTAERGRWEEEAERAGVPFSLPQRGQWDEISGASRSWLLVVTGAAGALAAALSVRSYPSRALPQHSILRVERFQGAATADACVAALLGVRRLATRLPRVVRAHVELFDATGAGLPALSGAARAAGFRPWDTPRIYPRTVTMDLTPEPAEIFAALHPTGRRHIRSREKSPVVVRPVEPDFPPAVLDALHRDTLARTGGRHSPQRWEEILRLSAERPDLSRVVGLFKTDTHGDAPLLAYAWGCNHGDHAHYATAASTRRTDLRVPMAYPLAWDLILWARDHGARVFDFGGISPGTAGSGDPLGGISDFKRRFTTRVVEVGEEWVFEPHPARARLSRWLGRAADRLRR